MDLNFSPIENPDETLHRRPTRKRSGPEEVDPEEDIEQELQPRILLSQSSPPRKQPRRSVRKDQLSSSTTEPTSVARQRGRPRLESQDQSAGERRRTQIRLAQRAYRQRKETTITELNQRVSHLETVVEEMNAAFSAFDDKMTSSGIPARNPAFARELSKARERFLDLTRSIAVEAGSEQEEEEPSSGTTSAPSYRLPETQLVGASSGLTVPQMPQQTSSQMVPDPLEQFSPFDLSQMPFYDYQTRVPGNTTSPPQSIIQDPPETTFGEEVEDPTLQDWDPNKPMQQYRVEVPEVCPAVYEAFFESNHPLGTAKNGEQVASLEGRRRFLCHLASSSDPNEVGQLIEILRRVTCSAKTSDQWYDKNSYAVGHSTSTKSRESIMSPSSSAELGPRVNHANACPANAGTLNDMTGEFKLGNRCPLSPGSSPSSVTENHDHDTVAFRLAEQCLDDHRGLLQGPRVANNDSISSLDSSSGYVRSQGHSGANTGLWFDDRSSGSPLSPPTSSDPARFYGSSDGRERAPFHAYNGSFPLS